MIRTVLPILAALFAGMCGLLLFPRIAAHLENRRHRAIGKVSSTGIPNAETNDASGSRQSGSSFQAGGIALFVLRQIEQSIQLCRQKPPARKRRSTAEANSAASRFVTAHAHAAGFPLAYTQQACLAVAKKHALLGAAIGIAFYFAVSAALGLMISLALCILGAYSPFWAILQEEKTRMAQFEKELPDFIDIVALGLKSGLSFERSLATYSAAFDTPLARSCSAMQRQWNMGLANRADGLMQLAEEFPSKSFAQLLRETAHALRLGTNLGSVYERSALAARNDYRLKKEEILAKAPVKMMLPISALVLPAMLLMVLGPVLLELFNTL